MGRIFVAAFFGKVVATIFIALCIALGFGPKEWAAMILGVEPSLLARSGFLILGCLAAVALAWPIISSSFQKKRSHSTDPEKTFSNQPAAVQFRGTARIIANGQVIPAANYNKAQIRKIVEAIDAIYPPLLEIERALKFGAGIAGSLEAIIRDNGAGVFLSRMDELRLKMIGPSDTFDKALDDFSLYTEICRVVEYKKQLHAAFFASYNELAGILREIPDKLSLPALAIFVDAKKATFISRVAEYLKWAEQKKKALSDYREWYLRRPTTD